jgi:hypothetical protein
MVKYPIRVAHDYYRGRDLRRVRKATEFNRVAARVETHINSAVADWPDDTFDSLSSGMIALDLGEDDKLVHEIVFSIDCGHNGVTILKGDYERAMEKRLNPAKPTA